MKLRQSNRVHVWDKQLFTSADNVLFVGEIEKKIDEMYFFNDEAISLAPKTIELLPFRGFYSARKLTQVSYFQLINSSK